MKLKTPVHFLLISAVLGAAMLPLSNHTTAKGQTPGQARQLQQVAPVTILPGKAKRWALVIGVDKYRDPQISPLKGSDNDARTLADALVRFAGFPADQVILMSTDQPNERQPTRVNILRRLSNLTAVVPKDGLLLISFAGHGMERNGQAYLLPSDAQISDDITFLEETAVSLARMKERIRATGVGQVIVLLDACRNDPGGRADAPNQMSQAYVNGFNFDVRNREIQAFATVYATAVGQRAYEYSERQQGYFTWAVVEGLKGAAANPSGEVTLAGLVDYVQNTVPKRIGIDLGGNKQQRPFAIVEGYKADQLVIALGGATNTTPASALPSAAPDSATLEMSFWDTIKNSNEPSDFQAYLDRFPNGTFAALARTRARVNTPSSSFVESRPASSEFAVNVDEAMAQAQRDLKDGDYAKAVSMAQKVLAANPANPKANLLLGLSYLKSGKYTNSANYLSKALALGEQVEIPIQHEHNVFMIGDALCQGSLRLGNGMFEFHSSSVPKDDFSVPLSKVYEMVVDQAGGGRIRIKVGIDKGTKEDKRNLGFYLPTAYVGKKAGSSLTWIFCDDCLTGVQSMSQMLQQLIREASAKQEISATAPPTTTADGTTQGPAGNDNDKLLQELLSLEQQVLDAYQRGDKAAVAALTTEDFTGIQNGKTFTKDQYLALVKPQKVTLTLTYETVKASLEGEVARLEGIGVFRVQGAAGMATVRQKFTDSYVKRGGKWLVMKSDSTVLK